MGQRLRHGWRSVILAIVDQGVVSYMRFGEAGFGCEMGLVEGKAKSGSKGGGKGVGRGERAR